MFVFHCNIDNAFSSVTLFLYLRYILLFLTLIHDELLVLTF